MIRSLISFAMVIVLLAATFISPVETHARRCGEKEPETLLSLYKRSSFIFIATFDRTEDGGLVEQGDDYSVHRELSYFTVSSSLKGETRKSFILEEKEYRYSGEESSDSDGESETSEETPVAGPSDHEEDEELYGRPKLKKDDTVILFLRKASEGEQLELVDYRDAIRKVKGEDLSTYEKRINELNVIFNSAGDKDKAVVEWLISLIDDPLTRWDGAYELLLGFYQLDWMKEEESRQAVEGKNENESSAEEEYEVDASERAEMEISSDRLRYARLITENHKQGLLNLLVQELANAEQGEDGKPSSIDEGNYTLLGLVKRWGDKRLAGHLLDRLVAGGGERYEKYQLMDNIASILKNEDLTSLAEQFGNHLYMDDNAAVENEDENAESEENSGDETENIEQNGDEPAAKLPTYGEVRAETLAKFIHAANLLLTTEA